MPKLRTVSAKLHHFCGDWATHGLKLIERHPDAKDLFDLRFPAVRQMYEDFILFLIEVLADAGAPTSLPLKGTVRNLVFSLRGLKDAATDIRHMEALVRLQVEVFLPALAPRE